MITGAHLVAYELPFIEPLVAGDGVHETRSGFLLGLIGDDGRIGWGEAAPLPGWSRDSYPAVEVGLRGLVESIADRPRPAENLQPTAVAWLSRLPSAAAALDGALLDLAAQRAGSPLASYLAGDAGVRSQVPVNALIGGDTPDEVSRRASSAAADGFRTFKMKLGHHPPEVELARVAALRDAVGDGVIRLDAERSWSPAEAASLLSRLEDHDIDYIEDPVGDLDALVQLGMSTGVPLAVDGLLAQSTDPLGVVSTAVADVFVLKPGALGGLTVASGIARAALGRGRRVVVTSFLESAIGLTGALCLAAALPTGDVASGLATSYLLAENVATPPAVEAGSIRVPTAPGLGVAPQAVENDGEETSTTDTERKRHE